MDCNYFLHFEDIRMIDQPQSLLLIPQQCFSSIIIDSLKIDIFDSHSKVSLNIVTFIDHTSRTSTQKFIPAKHVLSYINLTVF